MNDQKLKRLFELGGGDIPPAAPEGFDARVAAAVRREGRVQVEPLPLWDQLGLLLPRLAVAAVLLISSCALADFCLAVNAPSLADGVSEISAQWLFVADGN